MTDKQSYGALNAKIGALRGRLLTHADYYYLSGEKTVADAVRLLSEKESYIRAGITAGLEEFDTEKELLLQLAADVSKTFVFLSDNNIKTFFDNFSLKTSLNLLKLIFSSVNDRHDIKYSARELYAIFGRKPNVDAAALLGSKNALEFIDNLKGAKVYSVLKKLRGHPGAIEMELALDLHYYMNAWKSTKSLDPVNRAVSRGITGTEIDLYNITSIYRLKTFYKTPANSVYPYLVPVYYRVDKDRLLRMAESSDDALLSEILGSYYGTAFEGLAAANDWPSIAKSLDRGFYAGMKNAYRRMLAQNPESIASAAYYLFQKETEIKNLTTLLECIGYGKQRDEIMDMLYLT